MGSGGWGWGLGVGGFIFASRAEHQLGLVRIFDGLKASRCMWGGGGARANPKPSTPNPKSKPQPQTLKQGTRQLSRRGSESRKSAKVSFAALATFACFATFPLMIDSGRGAATAEDAQGTPIQSHISPSILVYEDMAFATVVASAGLLRMFPPDFRF